MKLVLKNGIRVQEAATATDGLSMLLAIWVHFALSGKLVELGEERKQVTDWDTDFRLRPEL